MCGIAGFVGAPDAPALERMVRALRHRGPDDRATLSHGNVHLGHTRLAVIDLEGGAQPMVSADASLAIVFNGEIYNYREIKAELLAAGYSFHTRSDTEVILAAYQAWGSDCLPRLDGMFAFVIHDRTKKEIFGARDRFGEKPLYYAETQAGFAFASEVTSLCHAPGFTGSPALSELAVVSYLLHDAPAAPSTIRQGVFQLLPGHSLVYRVRADHRPRLEARRYWDIDLGAPEGASSPSRLNVFGRDLIDRLDRAVERRLIADVPVGVLLSGGLDSSAIVAMMARHRPASEIRTFSIGFDDPSFDESGFARQVAAHFGTHHREQFYSAADVLGRLDAVIASLDEPLADPSILPTEALCEFARQDVTVALGGEGGDELLAGYDPFRALTTARFYAQCVPHWMDRWLLRPATRLLPRSDRNMSLDLKVERFLRGMRVPRELRLATWIGSFSLEGVKRLIPGIDWRRVEGEIFADIVSSQAHLGGSDVNRALDYFQRFYLPNDILRKSDRASMMHSLEVRCPFLATELAEWINGLPPELKFDGRRTKRLLRHALGMGESPIVPREIIARPKKGFGIPIARWLRNEMRNTLEHALTRDWPASLAWFDHSEIQRLVAEHFAGRNHAKELWALLVLSKWVNQHAA